MINSIRTKILVFVIVPLFLVVSINYFYNFQREKASLERKTNLYLEEETSKTKLIIQKELKTLENIAFFGAEFVEISEDVTNQEGFEWLATNHGKSTFLIGARIAFEPSVKGGKKVLLSVTFNNDSITRREISSEIDYTNTGELWYHIPKNTGKPYWDLPYIDRETGQTVSRVNIPIIKQGEFIGVSSVQFNILKFFNIFEQTHYKSFDLTLATREGILVLNKNWEEIELGKKLDIQFISEIEKSDKEEFIKRFLNGETAKMNLRYKDGSDNLIVYFAPVDFAGLLICISISENEAMQDIKDLLNVEVPKVMLITIFVIILTFIGIGRIINPLIKITEQIDRLSGKNKLSNLTTKSNDEIAVLVTSFNKLIDELLKRETELDEAKNRLNFALQASKDGVFDHNLQLNTLYFSDRMFEMLGYSPNEFTPSYNQFLSMIYHEDLKKTLKSIEDAEINKIDSDFEMRMVKKDGEIIWIKSKGLVVQRDEEGKAVRIVGTHTDITERKNYESQILDLNRSLERKVQERTKELQSKLDEIFELNSRLNSQRQALNAAAVVSVTDTTGTLIEVNDEFCKISKYFRSELIGQNYRILNSGYHSNEFWSNFYNSINSGNVVREKICNKAKDGSLFWLDSVIVPVKGSSNKIERFFTVRFDITDAVKAERALAGAEKKSRTILESITEGIFGTDLNGIITFVNPAACSMLGYSESEMTGQESHELIHHSYQDGTNYPLLDCPMYKSLKEGEHLTGADHYWRKDGTCIPVEFSSNPLSIDGKVTGAVVSFRDATLKRKLEEELNKALKMADNALKLANAGFWIVPLEPFKYIHQSTKTTEIFGMLPQPDNKYLLEDWGNILKETDETFAKAVFEEFENLISGKSEKYDIVYPFRRPIDGKVVWIRELAIKNENSSGETQLFGVVQDITKMKLIEDELSVAAVAANSIIDNIPIPTAAIDISGESILRVNKAMADFHGISMEELKEMNFTGWFENYGDIELISNIVKQEGYVTNYPVKFRRLKTGEIRDTLVSFMPVNYFGQDCLVGSVLDITDLTRVEKELALSLSTADNIIDSIMIPTIVAKTADGSILRINKAMAEFHQMNSGDLLRTKASEWYANPEDRAKLISILNEKGFITNVEVQFKRKKTGEIRSVLVSMIKVKYYDIEECQIGSFLDITEIKKIQSELEEAKKIAEDATLAKSHFLATMSHEIRTPMNAIIGLTNLVMKTDLNYKQHEYLAKIERSAFSLLGIINDILDFSKIEAGKLQLENIPFDLEILLESLSNNIAIKAQEKGLEFAMSINSKVPLNLVGDPLRIEQILANFCSNAVKFTTKGEVVVSVSLRKSYYDSVEIEFSVKDTGIGINQSKINELFSAFQQADSSITRKFGGTGLGLAISKKLAGLMNGKIWVESLEGEGSKFYFSVTLGVQNSQKRKNFIPSEDLKGMKVLVADDNESSREILKEILTGFSFNVSFAVSGYDAIAKLREHIDDPFDLLLIDWKMPGLDGIETTKIINDEFLNNAPVIVMVTGFGKEDIAHKASEIGIQGFLTKPVNSSGLFDLIMQIFHKEGKIIRENINPHSTLEHDLSQLKGTRVLLVEDNEINQIVASELLLEFGIDCDVASNGEIALKMLNESQTDNYDAVLMDIQMPVMDGYTATIKIKKNKRFNDLPVIAMSADAMVGVKEKCIEVGMIDYISKPVNPHDLSLLLLKWIKPSEKQKNNSTPKSRKENESVIFPAFKSIDVKEGLLRFSGKSKLYKELLLKFAESNKRSVQEIENAIKTENYDSAFGICHSIKGVSGNLGIKAIAELSTKLEKLLREKEYLASNEVLSNLKLKFIEFFDEIKSWQGIAESEVDFVKIEINKDESCRLFSELITLLEHDDYKASVKIDELLQFPGMHIYRNELKAIQKNIKNYLFEDSLKQLENLKNICES